MDIWGYVISAGIVLCTIKKDIEKKQIHLGYLLLGCIAALVYQCIVMGNIKNMLLGCIPGLIMIVIAKLTKEKIGYGDGAMIVVIGMCIGLYHCITVILISLTLISLFGLFSMSIKHLNRKSSIAYMPWLEAALVIGGVLFR